MKKNQLRKIIFTSLCIALGFIFVQICKVIPIANANAIFLPMHIPVLICGLVCGARYGMIAGVSLPLITFLLTGMPILFPIGLSMMFELATYGVMIALMYKLTNEKLYISLIIALIAGRIIYGIVASIFFSFTTIPFGMSIFVTSTIVTAFPGIVMQFILIPLFWKTIKTNVLRYAFS